MPDVNRIPPLVLALCAMLLAACGVRFADATPGTEFFTDIEISGEMRAGAPLTVYVQYEQFYPVDVAFHCELRREGDHQAPRRAGRRAARERRA
jgi:hypothetical protein